jgi:hypothetical protein
MGPVLPFLSPLDSKQLAQLEPVAKALAAENSKAPDAIGSTVRVTA